MQAIGVKVQNGYGLTETSPVVAARRPYCNVKSFHPKIVTPAVLFCIADNMAEHRSIFYSSLTRMIQ